MDGSRDTMRPATMRVPPHSIEAEQGVLGSLLISEQSWWHVADVVEEDDFYRRDHQLIFRAIKSLAEAKKPFDTITLGDWFRSNGMDDDVGGVAYIFELASTQASAFSIRTYADIVRDKAQLRRMIDVGTEITNRAFESKGRSAMELIGDAQTRLGSLQAAEPCELEPIGPVMSRVLDALQQRYESGVSLHGLSTGNFELDDMLGGLLPGLYLIAGRPKMGKTTLAVNIAEHVALESGGAVGIFSFEMTPEQLGERILASIGDIGAGRIRSGRMQDEDWTGVTAAMKRLHKAKIFVSRPRRAHVEHVVAQLRRKHAATPMALAIVDYLQLLEWDGDNAAQGIGQITRTLKLTAMELGIPILLLSQLNRKVEERPNKRPLPSDCRDSGAIEQDCDAMIFVYRDEVYHPESSDAGTAEIIVGLQRNGPTGMVRALYEPQRFRFSNLPEHWEPASKPVKDAAAAKPKRSGFRKLSPRDQAAGDAS